MAQYPKPTKGSRHSAATGYRSGIRKQLREDRQVQAKVRKDIYDGLSFAQKEAKLNAGNAQNGHKPFEATKQRHRLFEARKAAGTPAPVKKEKKS